MSHFHSGSVAVLASFLACAVHVPHSAAAAQRLELHVISSRPDAVSGGDALIQLTAPNEPGWTVQVDGRDVTALLRRSDATGEFLGLVTMLKDGANTLSVRVAGKAGPTMEVINHPLAGPIFSGPQQEPFICETLANGLGASENAQCSATTVVQYYYKSTEPSSSGGREALIASLRLTPGSLAPGFKPLDPAASLPVDVAQTMTSEGRTVNYIVRREIGTINRAVFDIQMLHQPGQPLPSPWTLRTPGWNGRLVYVFGGGRGGGHRQGALGVVGATQEPLLSQGYAVATSTLNMFEHNGNDRISAETLSMVKEYFIERYGKPIHTIGWGASGGAIQQYMTVQNYPGLLDGVIAGASFPDMTSVVRSFTDCPLLDQAFNTSGSAWSETQKTAVSGFATWRTCGGWGNSSLHLAPILNPRVFCDPVIPRELIFDPIERPNGLRCDVYSNEINFFGRTTQAGSALRPLDNVGVQYGLRAFNSGTINAEQFVSLNERVGGYDENGQIVTIRTEAQAEALRNTYERGLILTGGGGLNLVPIIDWRPYSDDIADIHDRFRSLVTRARLIAANGSADNQIILVDPRSDIFLLMTRNPWNDPDARFVGAERELVSRMNLWLDKIAADGEAQPMSVKVVRDRPADLVDGCRAIDGERISERARYGGSGRCNQMYPMHDDPRIAAGGPLTDDVLKCALEPINPAHYSHPLNREQLGRLKAVFPHGVCDYKQPGVGQQVTRRTWVQYGRQLTAEAQSTNNVLGR